MISLLRTSRSRGELADLKFSNLNNAKDGSISFKISSQLPFAALSAQRSNLQTFVQEMEKALSSARHTLQALKKEFISRGGVSEVPDVSSVKSVTVTEQEAAEAAEEARSQRLAAQLATWNAYPQWVDEPLVLQVTAPPGSFCDLFCSFTIGLPPEAVYDILCNPDNHRVFKNIKEVKARNVLEDKGSFQRVMVEQTAIWHFLWLSGTFDVCMEVYTDRVLHQIGYRLAEGGFMKRFEGQWEIQPLPLDSIPQNATVNGAHISSVASPPPPPPPPPGLLSEPSEEASAKPPRIASKVTLRQRLQPAVMLPPPISGYVRGISASATRSMVADLREEARRVREGRPVVESEEEHSRKRERELPPPISQETKAQEHQDHTRKGNSMSSRRRSRNRFRQKLRAE